MNNKYINISVLNLRIVLLILGSLIFLGLSFILLFYQRNNTVNTLDYSNVYILFAVILTLILIFSLIYLLFPIYLRVRRKKISTLNSKFTLYFILIALTPSIFLGIIGLVLINFGIIVELNFGSGVIFFFGWVFFLDIFIYLFSFHTRIVFVFY